MKYTFKYYKDEYFNDLEKLIVQSYKWGTPAYFYNCLQFDRGIHSAWANNKANWEQTTGLWEEDGRIVAVAISVGAWQGDAYFIFDSYERTQDIELLNKMFHHIETHMSCFRGVVPYEDRTRYLELKIAPTWDSVKKMAQVRGYVKAEYTEKMNILPFEGKAFEVVLHNGYTISDGNSVPPFFSANVHMFSFNYTLPTANTIKAGFEDLKRMKGYNPDFDLVALDEEGKPVGLAICWYDEKMPFCELEPLGVVWWCRRKGLGRAMIHELSNRIMKKYPACKGMMGWDQQFYYDLGFKTQSENEIWNWKMKF